MPTEYARVLGLLLALGIAAAGAWFGALGWRGDGAEQTSQGGATTTDTATPPSSSTPRPTRIPEATSTFVPEGVAEPRADPIYTAADAVDRCAAMLPEGATVASSAARLVSAPTLAAWLREADADGWPDAPLWLVGLSAGGVTLGDTLRLPGGGRLVADPEPVAGMFCVWDANSGELASSGALRRGAGAGFVDLATPENVNALDYGSLAALADEALTVEHATAEPTGP